jgi:hypothetical protein
MDNRGYRRVRMSLPVRLRWSAPFGQKIELAKTMDVARGGLLVSTKEPHSPGVTVWITFPYDDSLSDGQPEVPARVVRCGEVLEVVRAANAREKVQFASAFEQERSAKLDQLARAIGIAGVPATFAVAFRYESQPQISSNGEEAPSEPERRSGARKPLAVPVRVHPEGIPWFEEAMTIDISVGGMRLRSQRGYSPGEHLKIAFEDPTSAPWRDAREFRAKVVSIAQVPGSAALEVSVCRVN